MTRLVVEALAGPEMLDGLTAEWDALDSGILPRRPFSSPAWNRLWWKHFPRRNFLFRDEFYCHAMRDDTGSLVAMVPLMRTFIPGRGLPLLRILQFFGTDPSLTELRGVICRPERHDSVMSALVEHFAARRSVWDVFRWNGLRQPGPAYDTICRESGFIARPALPDYVIELPSSWAALCARVSSNMRKNLRKPYEMLARDGHCFTLRTVRHPDQVQAAVDRFMALHKVRSAAADMLPHPDKFTTPHARAFLRQYLCQLARRGELCCFELEIAGKVVASRLAFRFDTDLYFYYAGYDTAWRKYSIMTLLVAEMIKWAIDNGVRRVNLSTGNDQSKSRWRPSEILFHDAIQISPTLRGKLAYRLFLAYEALAACRDGSAG